MARTNSNSVIAILRPGSQGGDYDDKNSPSLEPFIDTASVVVDDLVTYAAENNKTLIPSKLELIERWLAAHFYCQSDKTYMSKVTAQASAIFAGKTGMHLESTLYGQTAQMLDNTGLLTALSKQSRAIAGWMGKTLPEQLTYDERN